MRFENIDRALPDLNSVAVDLGDLIINTHDNEERTGRSPFRVPLELTGSELRAGGRG